MDARLAMSHDSTAALDQMDKFFVMKKGSTGDPDIYLRAKLCKVQLDNGVFAWGMSHAKYVQKGVINVKKYLIKEYGGRKLPKQATALWPSEYVPEPDTTPELGPNQANY